MPRLLSSLLRRPGQPPPLTIAFTAIGSTLVATLLRVLLHPMLGERVPYATYFGAVVFAAWYAGLWGGYGTILLGAFTATYFFVPPTFGWDFHTPGDLASAIVFVVVSGAIVAITESQRRTEIRAEKYLDRLNAELTTREQYVRTQEEALARLDALFSETPIGLAFLDPQLRYVRLNAALAQLNGQPVEAHLNKTVSEILPQPEVQQVINMLQQVIQQRQAMAFELSGISPADPGITHFWQATYFPVLLGDEVLGVGGVVQDVTESRNTEISLRASEAQLRLITDAIPMLVSYLDHEARYQFNNRTYEEWFGVRREDIRGKTIQSIMSPESYEAIRPYVEAALAGKIATYEREVTYVKRGKRFIHATYIPDFDENQAVRGFFVVVRDVTDEKKNEARTTALHQLTTAFSRAVTTQDVATVAYENGLATFKARSLTIMRLNDTGDTLELVSSYNIRPEIIRRFTALSLEFDAPLTRAVKQQQSIWLDNFTAYNEAYPGLASVSAAEGTKAVAAVLFYLNNQIAGGVGIGFDEEVNFDDEDKALIQAMVNQCGQALERARLYQLAQEARERLEVTLTSIGDAVIATDVEGRISFMNGVAETLTGWTLAHAVGRDLAQVFVIVNEDTREPVESPFDKVIATQTVVGLANHTILLSRDGRQIAIDDSGAPIRNADGKIIGVVLVFRDITDRRKTEAAEREQRLLAEGLRDSAVALNSTLELGEVLDRILLNIEWVIAHDTASLFLVEGKNLRLVRSKGYSSTVPTPCPIADFPLFHEMLTLRHPLLLREGSLIPERLGMLAIPGMQAYAGVPLVARNEVLGFLLFGSHTPEFFTSRHADRLEAFAAQATLAIQNARAFLQAHELAVMEERQRLARDLHDAVSQTLFSSSLIAESLPRLRQINPEKADAQLIQLHRLNRGAFAEMRSLLFELRPSSLVEARIDELLQHLVDAAMARKALEVSVEIDKALNLPESVKITFYRIAQEALNNIIKHARATQVWITLTAQGEGAMLTLKDNGRGFDQANLPPQKGIGLNIMRERAESVGAVFGVTSTPGDSTAVTVMWQP